MKKNLLGVSVITLTCLYSLLVAIFLLASILVDIPVIYAIISSLVILIIQFLISPYLTDLTMKWFYKVKYNYNIPEYLNSFIDEICRKYNMRRPRIGFIDDGAPNAFTYGRTKNDTRLILTRGIFELLNEEEVKSVVAHEMGHAIHYDMLFMTVAQLVPLVLYGIFETFKESETDDDSKSATLIIALIAYVLYIISQFVVLWLSRTREYYADSFSINETKNPNALAHALVKIGYGLSTNSNNTNNKKHSASKSNALGIFDSKTSKALVVSTYNSNSVSKENIQNAMKWDTWNIWAKYYELFSTHPLISKRLNAISYRCKEFNQDPYITFNLKRTESYLDDFLAEISIMYLPTLIILITFMLMFLSSKNYLLILSIGGISSILFAFIKLSYKYKNKNYNETNICNLLNEVKVSGVTCIPCTLKGKIIGKGDPGSIFSEDFVLQDETGIILLDYKQPIGIVNKIFALFKSKKYIDKMITVKGWYRRSPVPYVEINYLEIDGKIKKCYNYIFLKVLYYIFLIIFILILLFSLIK